MRQASGPFVIALANLDEGVNHLRLEGSAEEAGLPPEGVELARPLVLEGDFVRTDNHVEVQARLEGAVRLECGRCLGGLEMPISSPIRIFCEKKGKRDQKRREAKTDRDEEGLMVYDGHTLDLRDEIRQIVLLEVPWHPLCKEDCRGLCPRCGKDRNLGDCGCERGDPSNPWNALRGAIEAESRPTDASKKKE